MVGGKMIMSQVGTTTLQSRGVINYGTVMSALVANWNLAITGGAYAFENYGLLRQVRV